MAKRYLLNQIRTISNRKVFFDANVLIYLFWPAGKYNWEAGYSKIFSSLLHQHNELYVDFLVISEVINRTHRIEYGKYLCQKQFNHRDFSYKKFRDSKVGKEALADIYLIVKDSILTTFSIVDHPFSSNDIQEFLIPEALDFIDKAILKICRENNFILCTNDGDYRNSKVDILSSNPAIFTQ